MYCLGRLHLHHGESLGIGWASGRHRYDAQVLCRVTKFNGVHCIDLHIPTNFGADSTKIHFIGFKGEFTEV